MTPPVHLQPLLGRENSFTFLRLLLALGVVFGHAYALGGFGEEPLGLWTGRHIAGREIAVQGFFVLSGFLIAKSLAGGTSLWRFVCHRVFRIFPALWVYLALMVFVVAPLLVRAQWPEAPSYGESLTMGPASAWQYLAGNWAAQAGAYKIIPAFATNPVPFVVNGSLWSVQIEVMFYIFAALATVARQLTPRVALYVGLGACGLALALDSMAASFLALACFWRLAVKPGWGVATLFALLYLAAVLNVVAPDWRAIMLKIDTAVLLRPMFHQLWHGPALAFLGGMLCWRFRDQLRWDVRTFALSVILLVGAARMQSWMLVMPLALPYCLLFLAARLPFQKMERWGDYSYGIYIFSFPIQQLLIHAGVHHAGVGLLFLASVAASVTVGAASWFLIEKPALRLGRKLGAWSPLRAPEAQKPNPTRPSVATEPAGL